MDKFADLIVPIILVSIFVISIIRSSKKKDKQKDAGKTMLPKGVYSENKPAKTVPNSPKYQIFTEKSKKKETIPAPMVIDNPEVNPTVAPVQEEIFLDENNENTFSFDTLDADELKRAIIYSEILNRKEYL